MMSEMAATSTWWVELFLGETAGVSTAVATLHTRERTRVSAHGTARLNPADPDVPQIGMELAAARALTALAHRLLQEAAADIEESTHELVTAAGLQTSPR